MEMFAPTLIHQRVMNNLQREHIYVCMEFFKKTKRKSAFESDQAMYSHLNNCVIIVNQLMTLNMSPVFLRFNLVLLYANVLFFMLMYSSILFVHFILCMGEQTVYSFYN